MKTKNAEPETKKLIEEETSAEGGIKLSIFLDYFKSAGPFISLLTFVFLGLAKGKLI